jgi:hypothetical protein
MSERQRILQETNVVRDKAEALLRGLMDAKSTSEKHLAAVHERDRMKALTGRSSMDNAIASTRRMIDSLDRTLSQLKRDLSDEDLALMQESA